MEKEMIKTIYEKIADKYYICSECGKKLILTKECRCCYSNGVEQKYKPVMIGDVLDYIFGGNKLNSNRMIGQNTYFGIFNNWKLKRKTIEEQSGECIEYVYNLIN